MSMSMIQAEPVEEDPHASKRAAMRQKKAWSGSRIEQAKAARAAELKQEIAAEADANAKKVDVWYVNMDSAHERKNCLERQFQDMPGNVKPNRYKALKFPDACASATPGQPYEQ